MSVSAMPAQPMPRALKSGKGQKVTYFGIEVEPEVTWRKWEPGQRYTKRLVLKNVNVNPQKLIFRVPKQDVFSTLYPKPITLSAGTSYQIPITFRPDEKAVYEDAMLFETAAGDQFRIPVKALLPQFSLRSQPTLDLGLCAVHGELSGTLELCNNSELVTPFRWEAAAPFRIDPEEGVLGPMERLAVRVTCRPQDARTYTLDAVCSYGSEWQFQTISQIIAIAKYPQVRVSVADSSLEEVRLPSGAICVDFGCVELSKIKERFVAFENTSLVAANVRVIRADKLHALDRCFDCPIESVVVPPKTAANLSLRFKPQLPAVRSVESFLVELGGGLCGAVRLQCCGESSAPRVQLSVRNINFYRLDVGQTASQPIELENHSDCAQPFQFQCDNQASVFALSVTDGVLKPRERRQIAVTFRPCHPMQFYRRLACLVPDQEPLFLDLIGTCHDPYLRPHVLQVKHVARFKLRKERGLSFFPPEELAKMLQAGKLQLDATGAVMLKEAEALEELCNPLPEMPPMTEFFYAEHDSEFAFHVPHIGVDRAVVDFGGRAGAVERSAEDVERGRPARMVAEEALAVQNNTRGAVLLRWMAFERADVFRVEPDALEIPAGKTQTFRVIFTPTTKHAIYGAELEAFVSFKAQREFQLVEEAAVAPPWCLTVRCVGHSFPPTAERFLPSFDLSRPQLVFPARPSGEPAFRTVGLANCGDAPILYRAEDLKGPFAVKPAVSVVQPGHQQLLTVRYLSKEPKLVSSVLQLNLNERKDVEAMIPLLGSTEEPSVVLDNKGDLFFLPTNLGNSSQRNYSFKNSSRMPIAFKWQIIKADTGNLSVSPQNGVVQPNETVTQVWTFTPQNEGKRIFKPRLVVRGVSTSGDASDAKALSVRVIAEGIVGFIKATIDYEDFGSLVVGTCLTRPLTLVNDAVCAVRVRLSVEQRIDGPSGLCLDGAAGREPPGLELSEYELMIPGRCKHDLRMTARPMRRVYYQHAISYQLLPDKKSDEEDDSEEPPLHPEGRHLCHALVTGVFPVLQVTDVQTTGAARTLSKRQSWSYLSLESLNLALDSDPAPAELIYSTATRQSFQRPPPQYTRAVMDLNFGAAPLGSDPSTFALLLENPGLVAAEFAFLLPEDLHAELEYWTETGDYSEQELHQMRIQEHQLFDVQPRRGCLSPGEQLVVELRHEHCLAGTDRLPVLLKIDKGREIMLNFVGVTVPEDRLYIHFPSPRHTFAPVPIGDKEAPVQIYELHNGGARPLHFEVDMTPLMLVQHENHDMRVFECLTPTGQVLPGRTAQIQWKFQPLEARSYSVDVPIRIHNGGSAVVTFTGLGFDRRQLGEAQPTGADLNCPAMQAIPLPDQALFLSQERLNFADVPLYSRSRRVVFLNNRSLEHAMTFKWHVTASEDAEVVHVSPAHGCVPPRGSMLCHVTFLAKGSPRFVDIDLICEVTDETRMAEFAAEAEAWECELRRQREEFNITEKSPNDDRRVWKQLKSGRSPALIDVSNTNGAEQGTPENMAAYKLFPHDPRVHIYTPFEQPPKKTLPPIHERPSVSEARSNRGRREFETEFWRKPSPPKPFVLHLGVTARSHAIAEFRQNFPELWPLASMDKLLMTQNAPPDLTRTVSPPSPEFCSQAEAGIVESTLTNLLHTLVNDTDFLHAVEGIPGEPVPYFCQYASPRPPRSPFNSPEERAVTAADECAVETERKERRVSISVSSALPSPLRALPESPCSGPDDEERPSVVCRGRKSEGEAERERVTKSTAFEVLAQSLLGNMVTNIVAEANAGDFDITSRPRIIALPPRSATSRRSRLQTPR